jgi:hypothetical protein
LCEKANHPHCLCNSYQVTNIANNTENYCYNENKIESFPVFDLKINEDFEKPRFLGFDIVFTVVGVCAIFSLMPVIRNPLKLKKARLSQTIHRSTSL